MSNVLKISGPIKVGNLAADPSGASDGYIYFNTTTDTFRMYENGAFRVISAEELAAVSADLTAHLNGGANKHDATEIDYERVDGSKKNIDAASDDVETALTDLDDAIGTLNQGASYTAGDATAVGSHLDAIDDKVGVLDATPTNYTPASPAVIASHLEAIDTALANAGDVVFADDEFRIQDDGDATKQIAFEANGITTANTRTITMPDADVDLGALANKTLSNLLGTSINVGLTPDGDGTRALGSLTNQWNSVNSRKYNAKSTGSNHQVMEVFNAGLTGVLLDIRLEAPASIMPSATASGFALGTRTAGKDIGFYTVNDAVADANSSGSIVSETGNKTAGTGDSGSYTLKTGTSVGGARGAIILDGLQVDVSSSKIVNLADPTAAQDAATKAYVDSLASGLDPKASVAVATTANLTLSGEQTIDGNLTSTDRVLVKDQTDPTENGIYVSAAGAWARAADHDGTPANEVSGGNFVFVEAGTVNASSGWVLQGTGNLTIDTDDLDWTQFSTAAELTAGDGLDKTGTVLSVNVGDGIQISSDAVAVDGTVTRRDGSVAFTADQPMGTNKITGLADGTAAGDAVNKSQLDTKISDVVDDTTPQLGGNLDTQANAILNTVKRGTVAAPTSLVEEDYIDTTSLTGSQTNTVIAALTFAHASFEGMEIVYKVKEATTNNVRIGTIRVVTNGTDVALNDIGTDTAETGISFSAVVNGANINIRYSSGTNGGTMRADVKKIRA